MSGERPDDLAKKPLEARITAPTLSALRQRIVELEEAVEARDAFIAVIAHELRNPMTPILGSVQRLQRLAHASEELPLGFASGLERLVWLIDRYVRRATTLLDVSRINAAKLNLASDDVDFAALLRGVVEAIQPAARHMRTSVLLAAPASIHGRCDRLAFEQISENLINNALKYGDEKPVHVSLLQRGELVELSVADAGMGISKADQARIFERFERVVSHARKSAGFGIGLFIVRQLVDAMNGRIEVQSAPGRGSTFTVELPLRGLEGALERDTLR